MIEKSHYVSSKIIFTAYIKRNIAKTFRILSTFRTNVKPRNPNLSPSFYLNIYRESEFKECTNKLYIIKLPKHIIKLYQININIFFLIN